MPEPGAATGATPAPAVTAVIVNYNAGELLTSCVDAVRPQVHQVVVVDNGSTDGSLAGLSRLGAGLRVVRNFSNRGFAAACNAGMRLAGDDHVLLLNPDCEVESGAVGELVEVLSRNPGAGAVGPLLCNPDGSEQRGGRRALPTPGRALLRMSGLAPLVLRVSGRNGGLDQNRLALPREPIEVEAISGACMMVRNDTVVHVGQLDEAYFMHCEDLDWCQRFHLSGWTVMFAPGARVVHHRGACSRSRPVFVEWHKHRGMLLFCRKFYVEKYPKPLLWLITLAVWGRFGVFLPWWLTRMLRSRLGSSGR